MGQTTRRPAARNMHENKVPDTQNTEFRQAVVERSRKLLGTLFDRKSLTTSCDNTKNLPIQVEVVCIAAIFKYLGY